MNSRDCHCSRQLGYRCYRQCHPEQRLGTDSRVRVAQAGHATVHVTIRGHG